MNLNHLLYVKRNEILLSQYKIHSNFALMHWGATLFVLYEFMQNLGLVKCEGSLID